MVIKSERTLSPLPGTTQEKTALRQALPQILAVCVKNVLLLGFGMTLGFPTILIPSLSGSNPDERIQLGQEAISWIGSINLICVPIGCLLSGAITQPIGRKRAMQLVNIPFLTAWLLFHFANESWQVFLALCITGLSGGLLEAPTLTYVAEITTPSLRGILASTSSVAVICGILFQFLLGTFFDWRSVALISCITPVLSFITLFFVPESPHWLISKKRYTDAQNSLSWLRGWVGEKEIEPEFKELCLQCENEDSARMQKNEGKSKLQTFKLYGKKSFLWPFAIVCLTFFLGHFSGMTTLQTYAVAIFATLKAPIDKYYATIFLGVAEVSGCILSACLVHYVGKRKMNFFSLIGCSVCFLIVATYAYLIDVHYMNSPGSTTAALANENWIPMTFLIAAAFFTHAGIRILPWMLIGEVYYGEIRATASGFSGAASYIFSFASNKMFFKMIQTLTLPGTFWLYGGICMIGFILLYFVLPETEGKTLFEITEHFAGNERIDNKVCRSGKRVQDGDGVVNTGFKEDENADATIESKL